MTFRMVVFKIVEITVSFPSIKPGRVNNPFLIVANQRSGVLARVNCFLTFEKPIKPFVTGATRRNLKVRISKLSKTAHLVIELWVGAGHYRPRGCVATLYEVLFDYGGLIFVKGCNDSGA